MDRIKMTGETSQQNPPSVFGFDPYPSAFQVDWNQSNPFGTPGSPPAHYSMGLQQQMCAPNPVIFPTQNVSTQSPMGPITPLIANPETPAVGGPQFGFNITSVQQPQSNFSFGAPKPSTSQQVVQFPFQVANPAYRCKRKTDSPPLQPLKQHITEEKMAEHMSNLHISSETVPKQESKEDKIQRLYMCEEMRKLQSDPVLPDSILQRMVRPCTALVLWRPPSGVLPQLPPGRADENENNNNNNNERELCDNNAIEADMDGTGDIVVPTMEMDNC